jgi:hypothetical protein
MISLLDRRKGNLRGLMFDADWYFALANFTTAMNGARPRECSTIRYLRGTPQVF